ncbi:MAG: glycosyltransferase [Cycloclasticus sp.]
MNVLIIASLWPEPNSSAAGRRMVALLQLFNAEGWQLTYACTAAESEYRYPLETMGIKLRNVTINDQSFDQFVKTLSPDLVLYDRFMVEEQFSWRVAEQCPQALAMIETSDLHCLRQARQAALKKQRAFTADDLMSDIAYRELASIQRSDLSLIISSHEMQLLKTFFKLDQALIYYLPFIVEPDEVKALKAGWPSYQQRDGFICIGNFKHPPNWDSVQYLKTAVWPLIRQQLPGVSLSIYGAYTPPKALQLNNPKQGFYIKGRVDDAQQVMQQARVCLAPLRFGAGLKGKLLDAMECGTPSVTTRIGAEGMYGELPWSGIIAEEPQALADAAVELYNNQASWQQCQQYGTDILKTNFNPLSFEAPLIRRIKQLKQDLNKHRRDNFQGAMLRHHSMRSTKYMSLWIEAKNKSLS